MNWCHRKQFSTPCSKRISFAYASRALSLLIPKTCSRPSIRRSSMRLPSGARTPVLDTIFSLQHRLAEYIVEMLKSEDTKAAIERFIDTQVDELLERRLADTIDEDTLGKISPSSKNVSTGW